MNYDYLKSGIRISVPSFRESKQEFNAIYYAIQIQTASNKWFVQKRFADFGNLMKSLKDYHSLPSLPPKNYFFNLSERELQNRRIGLQEMLRKIVIRNDLINSQPIKSFLQLDKNAQSIMHNAPKLLFEFSISGLDKGINDYFYDQQQDIYYIGTGDTNQLAKLNAKITNTKISFTGEQKEFVQVGSVQAWVAGDSSDKFMKLWSKNYPKQVLSLNFDQISRRMIVGLEDGTIDIFQVTKESYEDIVKKKVHQSSVIGVSYDGVNNIAYSVCQKFFYVSHGSSLALVNGTPHKQEICSFLGDRNNKRIFFGTKNGKIFIYDVQQHEKPKLLNALSNNEGGSVKGLWFNQTRNYLFASGYESGEINVFEVQNPGREKYAKLNATIKGKSKTNSITFSAKRLQIMTGNDDGNMTIWNAISGKQIFVIQASECQITKLQYVQDKQILISSSKNKTIKVWQIPKEWRSAEVQKAQKQFAKQHIKDTLFGPCIVVQDSDEDDLAGWHLD